MVSRTETKMEIRVNSINRFEVPLTPLYFAMIPASTVTTAFSMYCISSLKRTEAAEHDDISGMAVIYRNSIFSIL